MDTIKFCFALLDYNNILLGIYLDVSGIIKLYLPGRVCMVVNIVN